MTRTLSALPTMVRVGLAEAVAYRAELLIWVLTTTMPLVMLPLWQAVAEAGPLRGSAAAGSFGADRFLAYFLAAFVVRQLTSAWASWTINHEVKQGVLSMRLLRPVSPLWAYAIESLSAMPLRLVVALPVAILMLVSVGSTEVTTDPVLLAMVPVAIAGAWLITFLAHVSVGSLSFWTHSSIRAMDAWTAGFMVLSGYLVPIALFPELARELPAWLPFRYQLGFPVELLTRGLDREAALWGLAAQWTWALVLGAIATVLWRRGLRRYGAFGG